MPTMTSAPTDSAAPATVHPFARFGAAPFRFVGLETTEDRQAANAAAASAGLAYTTNMCGGSCDLCGTAIWNVFTFETADGKRFKVGCECAEKAGEGRQAKDGIKARKRAIRDEALRCSLEARLEAERMANALLGHGRVTNDELVAMIEQQRKDQIEALRVASRHFGTIGERVGAKAPKVPRGEPKQPKGIELRLEGRHSFETMFGWQSLYFLRRVDTGAAVVWKTSSPLGRTRIDADGFERWNPIEKGETFRAAFTVTGHGSYQGRHPTAEQQTYVNRLVVL